MPSELVAAVGFDLDHTIAIDNKLERVAFLRLLEIVLTEGGHALGTLDDETAKIDDLLALQRSGAFSIDDAVRRFVLERGVPGKDDYVERFRTMAVDMVDEFVIPLPEAKETFAALRERGIKTAVLSNGWNPLQIRKAQRAGFEGPVLASADIGQQKPGSRAFSALLETLGTTPQQTWYVGDDPRGDVEGARTAGINAVWFDWEKKKYPLEIQAAPYTIHALQELLALMPATTNVL